MNYATIKYYDIANGEGIRISLFVSGCKIHCKNCFNSCAWDFNYGKPLDEEIVNQIITKLKEPYIDGITILGGEPFEIENQKGVYDLLLRVKKETNKNIWVFTGYHLEDILNENGKRHLDISKDLLSLIDILVDGPFIEEKKKLTLKFRGSSNQRIIDMKKTLINGEVCLSPLNNE